MGAAPDSSVAAYLEDDAVVATGRARSLPRSTWYEVTAGGYTGWASAAYLAYPAPVEDVTDEVTRAAGGLPEAGSMDELARIVLEALEPLISGEPVTVSGPGWFEGLAEMEIDLVVRGSRHFGQRLYIVADASIDWDDTFEIVDARLRSASLQTLCSRAGTASAASDKANQRNEEAVHNATHEDSGSARIAARQRPRSSFRHP